ncbi:LysR family transcriptional regulator [Pseudohoeflea coraliihabitans]|uniref:LysR family transcriptional regulator n=1 Tax=Pseudohoeflea coraliihabitans TaxID=2860393 RepID=A0ABS6WIK6_9HYPH|nr:LysR family transcriptional regulator [Pseudohoeflea sp. DP4N28-3]MBW3095776.1 LysR family transcriptional regulator [Pseudohoeflea sp. DP4N28-3]
MNAPLLPTVPTLDPELLRSFVAIAETGRFASAAERVHRTPSAVSMQIKRLEEVLGVAVFARDARNVTLTPDGEVLLGYARRLLALNRETMSRFVSPSVSGIVKIGAPSDYGEVILPKVLKRFAASHPQVVVDVVIDQSSELRSRFAAGQIDLAVTSCGMLGENSGGELMMTDDIVWVGAKGGQAYLCDPLPVSLWDENCAWRQAALTHLEKVGRHYRVAFMTAHMSGQRAAILSDLAVAPMGRKFTGADLQILGPESGLPDIGNYGLMLHVADGAAAPTRALADHMRSVFEHFRETGSFGC